MIIESRKNPYILELAKLKDSKFRKLKKQFLIEGEHIIIEALKKNIVIEIIKCKNYTINFDTNNIKIIEVSKDVINKLSFNKSQSQIIAVAKYIENELPKELNKVIIFDTIQNPENAAAIIRTAVAFDYDAVIFSDDSIDFYNEKFIRASQGSQFLICLIKNNIIDSINLLKEKKIPIIATMINNNSINCTDLPNYKKHALILGNEGQGIKKETSDISDIIVKINISDKINSLNVTAAAAIIMYQLNK